MIGLDPMYQVVTRARHEEDVRRAEEARLVREAKQGDRSLGLIWKLFSQLAVSEREVREAGREQPAANVA